MVINIVLILMAKGEIRLALCPKCIMCSNGTLDPLVDQTPFPKHVTRKYGLED